MQEIVRTADGYVAYLWNDGTGPKVHREDGPAIMKPDGYQSWWQNNHLHRDDGPAIIRPDGDFEFWWQGIRFHAKDLEDFQEQVRDKILREVTEG